MRIGSRPWYALSTGIVLSACSASGPLVSDLAVGRHPLEEANLRIVAPLDSGIPAATSMAADAGNGLRTVAPLVSGAELEAIANALKTVAPLNDPTAPDLGPVEPASAPIPKDGSKPKDAAPVGGVFAQPVSQVVASYSVAVLARAWRSPEDTIATGRAVARRLLVDSRVTRVGMRSDESGQAISEMTVVATGLAGNPLLVMHHQAKQLVIWHFEGIQYEHVGPALEPARDAGLEPSRILAAWRTEQGRSDRQAKALALPGALPKFALPPSPAAESLTLPLLVWPGVLDEVAVTSGSPVSMNTSLDIGGKAIARTTSACWTLDWFAWPEHGPLVVARTVSSSSDRSEEVVFDAESLAVLAVHLTEGSGSFVDGQTSPQGTGADEKPVPGSTGDVVPDDHGPLSGDL